MENEKNQSTTSEQAFPEALDEFDKVMQILSDLPTAKALQELSKGKIGPSIQKVIEVMEFSKEPLVQSFRLMRITNDALLKILVANKNADDAILRWCKENPDRRIDLVATTPDDPEKV